MNVDALQIHLTNLSQLLRGGGGKGTANELDEFVQLLQPYRDKKLKDLIGTIKDADEVLRAAPPAPKKSKAVSVDISNISARIVDLYQRAGQPNITSQEIMDTFAELQSVNPNGKQLESIAKQIGVKEKLKKDELLKKMRETVLDRKGASDRAYA
ncbi:MAG: hypothetical protein HY289_07320 [Planctomycetes bacterium]|nr:hypothetical protein [Planctomycetota bacterium]